MNTDPVASPPRWAPPAEAGPVPAVRPPPEQRIGRAEREQAEQHLRWALAEDVLTIGEFDERLGRVMQAKTAADLDRVLEDLPRPERPPRSQVPLRECSRIVAVMGGIDIVVADDADVDLDGFAIMGGRENKVAPTGDEQGPLVRINGYALMGGIVVRPANSKERKRHPVESQTASPRPVVARGAVPPRKKSWVGRIVGIGLLAALALWPGRAAVTADAVAIFGGNRYEPPLEERRGEESVDVFSLFGGVDVVIPEGHSARLDSFALFGGTDCEQVCDREGAEIEVDATAIFGGVNVSDGTPDDD